METYKLPPPIFILSDSQLVVIARRMRAAADRYPKTTPHHYANTEAEAFDAVAEDKGRFGRWLHQQGLAAVVRFEERSIVSLALSRDDFEAPPVYRLSAVRWTVRMQPGPMPDDWARRLLLAFFGDRGREVANPSAFDFAKHFTCEV